MPFGIIHGFGAIGALIVVWWFFRLLVVGAVVFLVVYAVRSLSKGDNRMRYGKGPIAHDDSAKRILDERYARGEISAEEYREMKEELRK
ncbi:SHOCT domain-containing protein [Alicyclobacillus sp. SO9]|uniref:SHOCT domain-containing protein n=1 Tax=Alicyclobacillus sp. SO9 TaxID=2665646 RepID=UPI0018E8678A|nr:SHOCT domain-containing protein [Alicyclobacillus sp. SO9]QQE79913.1 SHOCT domain-containing protein [Alicyclobacillus sp. SO9]